ncbi:FtsW/RodA/SpoVE family cell cycle protein [Antribacter sp. KLBMP9083]|uniref:FtsW/RodA/SpoVE family cell cycle protein n=1 Tax=Antribacter soli TaxID=2910976 RepID=A0AA41QCV5_9MICO|nr:FtsW/RodA/SpoVE family cell cycle protein [Antribacter soli]MCF4120470.1 FtsW/RodA/SpoVE family cell cycle protein [Antribacter soli]
MSGVAPAEPGMLQTDERVPARVAEAFLLVVALVLSVGAIWMVGESMVGGLPPGFWTYTLGLTGLALALHLLLRFRAPYADQVILPAVVLLNGLGLAMVLRIDLEDARFATPANAGRHFMWILLAMLCAGVLLWFLRDHRSWRKYTYTAMIAGIVLVMLPLIPGLGRPINGAKVWIFIGPFSLQPAEFAKIAFAVFFAGYLVTNRDTLALAGRKVLGLQLPRARDLGPILVVWAISLGVLVGQTDLGTSLLFFGLFVGMLYLATERGGWVAIGLVMFASGAVLAWSIFGHVQRRVDIWLNPFDPELITGASFQIVQGLFGLAHGGMFGAGWGEGMPYLVPYAYSDFIYSALGEELGLTGLLGILLVYLVIVERGLRNAIAVRDGFGKLLAGGLAFVMALQLFVVIGGITRIIPLTGLTLPFMAQGGSSLLANWVVVALLLRISDNARRPSALPMRGQLAGPTPHEVGQGPSGTGALPVAAGAARDAVAVPGRSANPPGESSFGPPAGPADGAAADGAAGGAETTVIVDGPREGGTR